jgi:hypothetical protein
VTGWWRVARDEAALSGPVMQLCIGFEPLDRKDVWQARERQS